MLRSALKLWITTIARRDKAINDALKPRGTCRMAALMRCRDALDLDVPTRERRLDAVGAGEMRRPHRDKAHARSSDHRRDRLGKGVVARHEDGLIERRERLLDLIDHGPCDCRIVALQPRIDQLGELPRPLIEILERVLEEIELERRLHVGEEM